MAALIDFDREYMLFAAKKLRGNTEIKDEELTQLLNDTMKEWLSTKAECLGNKTPDEYFSEMSAEELVGLICAYCDKNMSVPEPLYGRIGSDAACIPALKSLFGNKEVKASARASALRLLCDMNAEGLSEICVAALSCESDISEIAAERLKASGYDVVALLEKRYAECADSDEKAVILDILACYPGVEATADKLIERLYNDTEKRAFYANIAGKFGDDRLLEPLMRLSQMSDMVYFDYIEIMNAIDALGGEPGSIREFYGDPDYEALRVVTDPEDSDN